MRQKRALVESENVKQIILLLSKMLKLLPWIESAGGEPVKNLGFGVSKLQTCGQEPRLIFNGNWFIT